MEEIRTLMKRKRWRKSMKYLKRLPGLNKVV